MAPVDKFIRYTELHPQVVHVPLHHMHRDSMNPFLDLSLLRELTKLLKKFKPDLVLTYTIKPNIYGAWAAKWAGIPSVSVVTGLGYSMMHNGWLNWVTRILYKTSLRYHQYVVFENE